MTDLFDNLRTRSSEVLTSLVAEAREESLHLEFKTVADPTAEKLSKEDKKRIAKAICGMANAESGILLVGVETRSVDGLDVATALAPMAKAAGSRGRLCVRSRGSPTTSSPSGSGRSTGTTPSWARAGGGRVSMTG